MKIEDALFKTPEMSEEKLLKLIDEKKYVLYKEWARNKNYTARDILNEWDLIQQKKSKLTKSQRDQINMLVSMCLITMVKENPEKSE